MNALEHAFDFMEQAFENGEEMVVFVTELTLTPEAAMFLSEHTCERYMTYNEQLLIGKTEKRTLIRTESLGNTHGAGNSARMEIKMKQSETRNLTMMMDLYEMTMANGYFNDQDKDTRVALMYLPQQSGWRRICDFCRVRADFRVH